MLPYDPCLVIPTINCGVSNSYSSTGSGIWNITNCGFSTPGQEKLFSFTPTCNGMYTFQVTTGTNWVDWFWKPASGGCLPTGWTCIDDIFSAGTISFGPLTAGTAYYIMGDPEQITATTQSFQINCLPSPAISGFAPTAACSGASVVIAGSGFTGATGVTFGGTAAASFVVNSDIQITAVVSSSGSSGSIGVTGLCGTGTLAGFTFNGVGPVVTVSPTSGVICLGDSIAVTATDNAYSVTGTLGGTQEVPPNGSSGSGNVTASYDGVNNALMLTVTVTGLSANISGAHIHGPATAGANAGVIHDLVSSIGFPTGVTAGTATGLITLSASQELDLYAGLLYVNIHTSAFSGGEVRAQLSATASSTYAWLPATGLSNPSSQNTMASPASTTTYTVTVTNLGGCSSTATTLISVDAGIVITASATDSTICAGSSAILNATQGATSTLSWVETLVGGVTTPAQCATWDALEPHWFRHHTPVVQCQELLMLLVGQRIPPQQCSQLQAH
nr:CHRD domain-containing protein [Bacteroidota bacterium]